MHWRNSLQVCSTKILHSMRIWSKVQKWCSINSTTPNIRHSWTTRKTYPVLLVTSITFHLTSDCSIMCFDSLIMSTSYLVVVAVFFGLHSRVIDHKFVWECPYNPQSSAVSIHASSILIRFIWTFALLSCNRKYLLSIFESSIATPFIKIWYCKLCSNS